MNQINKDLGIWREAYKILQTSGKWNNKYCYRYCFKITTNSCFKITRFYSYELFQFDSLAFDIYKKGEKVVSTVNYSEN